MKIQIISYRLALLLMLIPVVHAQQSTKIKRRSLSSDDLIKASPRSGSKTAGPEILPKDQPAPPASQESRKEAKLPPPVLYGDPKPHPDDPSDPWTCESLRPVEADVAPGQKHLLTYFTTPKWSKEAVIEVDVANTIRNVALFVVPLADEQEVEFDPSPNPEGWRVGPGGLGFTSSAKPGVRYAAWAWNRDGGRVNHVKLKMTRHYR